jgi:hypothetical protein
MFGQTLGSLTVLEERFRQYKRSDTGGIRTKKFWLVQCSCGTEPFELSDYSLRTGSQVCKSCSHSGDNNSMRSHGESDNISRGRRSTATPEYRCWKAIKNRCNNPRYKQYQDYGGRGIRVCQRWLDSYENFLIDMGRKPNPTYSIQRRDNDGNYSPENCYWATDEEQRRNKRGSRLVTIQGQTRNLVDWLVELSLPKSTFFWRKKQGWSDEEALFGRY